MTNVATVQLSHTVGPTVFTWLGQSDGHHSLSHAADESVGMSRRISSPVSAGTPSSLPTFSISSAQQWTRRRVRRCSRTPWCSGRRSWATDACTPARPYPGCSRRIGRRLLHHGAKGRPHQGHPRCGLGEHCPRVRTSPSRPWASARRAPRRCSDEVTDAVGSDGAGLFWRQGRGRRIGWRRVFFPG